MRSRFVSLLAVCLAAMPSLSHAVSDDDWGLAAGELVSTGYWFELASSGICAKYAKRPHDHRADAKEVLTYVPDRLRSEAMSFLSEDSLAERRKKLRVSFDEIRKMMVPVGTQEFSCGMSIGMAVQSYFNARQKWSRLTGAPTYKFEK